MVHKYDFLVIGSGLAGMSFALKVAHKGRVALICKAGLEEANTYYATLGKVILKGSCVKAGLCFLRFRI